MDNPIEKNTIKFDRYLQRSVEALLGSPKTMGNAACSRREAAERLRADSSKQTRDFICKIKVARMRRYPKSKPVLFGAFCAKACCWRVGVLAILVVLSSYYARNACAKKPSFREKTVVLARVWPYGAHRKTAILKEATTGARKGIDNTNFYIR